MEDRWYKSEERRPPLNEIVWGIFRGKNVELVQVALAYHEYDKYLDNPEDFWHSLESEKLGSVTHWRPLIRPELPME